MNLFRSLFTLALLAMLLVAGQHCALEAAGLLGEFNGCEHAACCAGEGKNPHERCNLAEDGSIAASVSSVKVPSPQLLDDLFVLCLVTLDPIAVSEPPSSVVEAIEGPREWVPAWSFERRSAQTPRAPSLSFA